MSLKFLQKVPGKIRKYSWMGNWNREMLNNGESREPETCWPPETQLVLSCCAQALHKISKLFMWVNDGFYFFSKLEGSSHCLLCSLFSTFSTMNMGTTACDDSACYIQTNVLKILRFCLDKRKTQNLSRRGAHWCWNFDSVSFFKPHSCFI